LTFSSSKTASMTKSASAKASLDHGEAPLEIGFRQVPDADLESCLGGGLGDPGAHVPGPEDGHHVPGSQGRGLRAFVGGASVPDMERGNFVGG
jgi:hypothetical protein